MRNDRGHININSIHSFSSIQELDGWDYSKPPREMRGYGFLDIAIFLGTSLARRHGVNMITIKPASFELSRYYESCGFVLWDGDAEGKMVFPIKQVNP